MQNARNRSKSKNNKSGTTGVTWIKKDRKWRAYIRVDKRLVYLGSFSDITEAVKVRKEAEKKYFKEFAYNRSKTL
jgi:hypothetical protein